MCVCARPPPDECIAVVLHQCRLVHGPQPGVHVLLGVGAEVIRPHPSVLRLWANHRALLVNVRAHTRVASLWEERGGGVSVGGRPSRSAERRRVRWAAALVKETGRRHANQREKHPRATWASTNTQKSQWGKPHNRNTETKKCQPVTTNKSHNFGPMRGKIFRYNGG